MEFNRNTSTHPSVSSDAQTKQEKEELRRNLETLKDAENYQDGVTIINRGRVDGRAFPLAGLTGRQLG